MLIELIATVSAGFAGAGLIMLLRALTRRRVPRPLIPIMAGLAMIGYAVWSEYTWFERSYAALPEGYEVVHTSEETAWFRPWTFISPYVHRFSAVDMAGIETRPEAPGLSRVRMVFLARWTATDERRVLVDCINDRQADGSAADIYDADGTPSGAVWYPLETDHPLHRTVCKEG